MGTPRVLGRAAWRYFRHPGTERTTLYETEAGYRLAGNAQIRFPEGLARFTYAVVTNRAWEPRAVQVDQREGRRKHFLRIEIDEDGTWEIDGFPQRELRGFTDFDMSASPSTNTLAIRRLDLPLGGSAEIRSGWMVSPDLEVRPVRQRYTRLAERHYRYEGLHNGFVAEFDVDAIGLVVRYPDFWERIPLPQRGRSRKGTGRSSRKRP